MSAKTWLGSTKNIGPLPSPIFQFQKSILEDGSIVDTSVKKTVSPWQASDNVKSAIGEACISMSNEQEVVSAPSETVHVWVVVPIGNRLPLVRPLTSVWLVIAEQLSVPAGSV